mmetsp:Transcript_9535/g.31918  ORF Transcript_9535/g.31918 Transcript_9535/m.31918 type:complete len:305 (-) Transcript_9535:3664-4578(-)
MFHIIPFVLCLCSKLELVGVSVRDGLHGVMGHSRQHRLVGVVGSDEEEVRSPTSTRLLRVILIGQRLPDLLLVSRFRRMHQRDSRDLLEFRVVILVEHDVTCVVAGRAVEGEQHQFVLLQQLQVVEHVVAAIHIDDIINLLLGPEHNGGPPAADLRPEVRRGKHPPLMRSSGVENLHSNDLAVGESRLSVRLLPCLPVQISNMQNPPSLSLCQMIRKNALNFFSKSSKFLVFFTFSSCDVTINLEKCSEESCEDFFQLPVRQHIFSSYFLVWQVLNIDFVWNDMPPLKDGHVCASGRYQVVIVV